MPARAISYPSAEAVIYGFYDLLDKKEYPLAFEALTPNLQEQRWQSDVARFAAGYHYTMSLTDIRLAQKYEDEIAAQYAVTYTDKVNVLHHPLLEAMIDMPAEERKSARTLRRMADFKVLLVEQLGADTQTVEAIAPETFFGKGNVEAVLWSANANYIGTADETLFTRQEEIHEVKRVVNTIQTATAGWLIDGIRKPA